MSRPMANNAPPTPPATPPPQDDEPADIITNNLTRTVGKGALHSGLAGGLGTITMVPMGGLIGGLVGVVYGSVMASTEGIRERYQPNGWGTNGVPPTYAPQQPVPERHPSQRALAVRNGGFPHGLPSQRKKQNPRAENVRGSGQKRMSSSPGPAPDRILEGRPRATPRSKLDDSVSSPPSKRITSMTKLPPISSSIDPATATPRTSRSPISPSKRITSLSPIPKLNATAAPISTPQAPPPESTQRKTLPSNPKPKSTTGPKITPPTPKASPAPPDPAPNSYPALNRNTSVSVLRPSLVPPPLKPAAPPAAISNTYPSLNRNTSISTLMPTAPEPAARSGGRRRRKGGANGSESSGSQAGDSRDSLQDRKLSIIDTYLG